MAKIVTIKMLVDSDDKDAICALVYEALYPTTLDTIDEDGVLCIDFYIDSDMEGITADIEDSIVNETYEEGDAFR